jgi:predicted dithiol-disulfide oxidoreductase (DUF899 family)
MTRAPCRDSKAPSPRMYRDTLLEFHASFHGCTETQTFRGLVRNDGAFCCAPPAPNQYHRAGDMADPLWNLFDTVPEGREKMGFPKVVLA